MTGLTEISYAISYSLILHFITLLFFFNDTATTEIYTLSLHDALPISMMRAASMCQIASMVRCTSLTACDHRSEEHTSELQSQSNLVCRLLLEKKKKYVDDYPFKRNTT